MHRAVLALISTVMVAWSLSGCAFGTRKVNLVYGPTVDNAKSRTIQGRIAVARLRDNRTPDEGTGTLLGKVRNGYGIPTASVHANQDPVIWVNEAIARTLTSWGFRVEKVETSATAGGLPTVVGSVDRMSGGMYLDMDAFVKTNLAVEQNGERLFEQQCEGEGKQGTFFISANDYQKVFQKALEDYLQRCLVLMIPTLEAHAQR